MDQQRVDTFIMTNQKYFPPEKIMYLKDKLRTMDEQKTRRKKLCKKYKNEPPW